MSKAKLWVGGLFTPIGLTFAGIGGAFYAADQALEAKGGRASGTVVALNRHRDSDGDTMYKPEVEFRDSNGTTHRFVSGISSSSPGVSRGESVDVIYDPDSPGHAAMNTFMQRYFFPLLFGGLGGLFALLGGAFLWSYWHRRKVIGHLQSRGMRIDARFTRCTIDRSIAINGRSPYVVEAQAKHPATANLTTFKSEPIWLELTPILEGKKVPVLIDVEDPDDHYIDLSEWVPESERA